MRIFLIFALIGAAMALQYPIEYQYQYSGRIATGIPGISPQVAALGIKAKLIVQMKSEKQAVAQIRDVLVGKMNKLIPYTFLRPALPITYKPLPEPMERQMSLPFSVNLLEDKDHVMDVSDKDDLWMTNVRKSIIETLLLEPIRYNKDTLPVDHVYRKLGHIRAPASFAIEEETIFGRCESQYSITMIPRSAAMDIERMLQNQVEIDIQNRKEVRGMRSGTVPKIDDKLWKLVRSISFDSCRERVLLQHASVSNTTKAGNGQFDQIQSRSSVGTYILRGSTGAFRVERAVIEGNVARRPLGIATDKLQSMTNQTIHLQKVTEIQSKLSLPSTRPVKTWRYEVLSPYSPPFGVNKLWVDYTAKGTKYSPISMYYILLGLKPNSIKLKTTLEEELQKAATELMEVPRPPAELPSVERNHITLPSSRLQKVSSILEILPVESIRQVFEHAYQKKGKKSQLEQVLLIDAAAAAGSSAPMKIILEYIENGKVSSARAASIFITLTNQVSSPAIIPELLEYVKSIDVEERPYLASAVLINFAKLANRMCLNTEAKQYSALYAIYGSENCKPSRILNDYLPHLKQLLRRLPKSHEKAIVVQAIAELGASEALPTLVEVAHGEYGRNSKLRSIALYAMSDQKINKKDKKEVLDVLTEIIENIGEIPEMRQAAVVSLMSHNPPPAFYHRLARLTWRDSSQQTAAFIYLTLQSLAKSTGAGSLKHGARADYALPLAKPYSPSLVYSYNYVQSNYNQNQDIKTKVSMSAIINLKSYIPKEMFLLLENNYAGLQISPIQVGIFADGINTRLPYILEELHKIRLEELNYHYAQHPRERKNRQEEIINELRKLNLELPIATDAELAIFLRLLDNMVSYIPLNNHLLKQYAGHGAIDLIKSLERGVKYNLTKYLDPVEITYVMPTEIGLPLISTTKMPTIQYAHGHLKLNMDKKREQTRDTYSKLEQEKKMELLIKSKYKLISRLESKYIVYSPWDESQIEAGVDTAKVINLPLYLNISVSNHYARKGIKINVSPITKHAFAPIYAHNVPYTAYKPSLPVSDGGESSIKIIRKENEMLMKHSQSNKKVTGIDSVVKYCGDVPYPFTSGNYYEYLSYPSKMAKLMASPTAKVWQTSYILNPINSPTKNVSVSLSYTSGYVDRHESVMDKKYMAIQPKHIANKMTRLPSKEAEKQVIILEAGILYNGTQNRKYNSLLACAKTTEPSTKNQESYKKYETQLHLYAHPVAGYREDPNELIVKTEVTTPEIKSLKELKEKLQSYILKDKINVKVNLYPDYENPILNVKGKLTVSEERRKLVLHELENVCQYDKSTPTSRLQVAAIYDKAEAQIKYKLDQIPSSVHNYSIIGEEVLKGIQYPHVYVNKIGVQNAPEQIKISMNRPVNSKYYKVEIEKPREKIVMDKVNLRGWLSMVPYYGMSTRCSSVESTILPDIPLSSCKITKEKIVPFNKVSYPYKPLHCWTNVAYDPKHPEEYIIEVKKNSHSEIVVKASSDVHGIAIKISDREIKVNGRKISLEGANKYTVEDSSKKRVAYLFKVPDEHIYAVVNQRYVIRLHYNDVHIFDLKPHGSLIGACGTTNAYEMVGPKGCIYRNENTLLLKYAYTKPEGSQCDIADYETYVKNVKEFQTYCTKKTNYLSGKSPLYADKPKDCYKYVYPIITNEQGSICVSEKATQRCRQECYPSETTAVPVKMKCWSPSKCPIQVLINEPIGYTKHPVSEREEYEIGTTVIQNIKCRSNYA